MGSVIQRAREVNNVDDMDLVQLASGIWCPSVQGPGGLILRDQVGSNHGAFNSKLLTDWNADSLEFNGGATEYVKLNGTESMNLGDQYSVSCWFLSDIDGHAYGREMVSKYTGSGAPYVSFGLEYVASDKVRFSIGATDNTFNNFLYNTSLTRGVWHHAIGTYDGAYARLFIDGAKVVETAFAKATKYTSEAVYVGNWGNASAYNAWNGKLDDARIYPHALKPQQIKRLYSNGQGRGIGLRPSHYVYEPIRVNYDADLVQSATGIWCPSVQGPGGLTLRDLRRVNNAALTSTTWENDHGISLSLNGTTSYGVIENYDDHVATMALSAWVKADTLVTWGTIAKLWPNTASLDKFHFGIQASDGDLSIYIRQDDNTQLGPVREGAGMPLPTGSWHHVAFVCDGAFIRLYRDGNEVGTAISYDGTMNAGSDFIGLGAKVDSSGTPVSPGGSPGYWDGMIDDVRVFPMLTSQQIKRLYSGGQGRGIGLGPDSLVSPFTTQWGSVAAAEAAAFQAAWGASATTIAGVASGQ